MPIIDYPPIPMGTETFSYVQIFYTVTCPTEKIKHKKYYTAKTLVITALQINGKTVEQGIRKNVVTEDFSKWNIKTACVLGQQTIVSDYTLSHLTDGYNISASKSKLTTNYYIPVIKPDLVEISQVRPETEKIIDGTATTSETTEIASKQSKE